VILVTERAAESFAVFAYVLGVRVDDLLVISSKVTQREDIDPWSGRRLKSYNLSSPEWTPIRDEIEKLAALNTIDQALYAAANRRLDAWINDFPWLRQSAKRFECLSSILGEKCRPELPCLHGDQACNLGCVSSVLQEARSRGQCEFGNAMRKFGTILNAHD